MPNLRVDNIKNKDGTNGPIFEGNLEFSSTAHVVLPKGTTAERPVGISTGSIRFNTETKNVEYYNGTSWIETTGYARDRGVFGGGYAPSATNTVDYITISSTGNATDFGDLTVARTQFGACSSKSRGVFGGGASSGGESPTYLNVIDYITIATTGNATDFGDLTNGRRGVTSCSNSTRGVWAGGYTSGSPYVCNIIDYITIETTGNATDFGDLTAEKQRLAACSSNTRGLFGGGSTSAGPATRTNVIDYITIASVGNATDFGDLTAERNRLTACSSSTRGLFGGGYTPGVFFNVIDYVTIASTGNATDFGDLVEGRFTPAGTSNNTRGVFGGGRSPVSPSSDSNTIDYVTIASTGNATDFGDLTVARTSPAACSDCHGGIS
jgi:hypothetical protein